MSEAKNISENYNKFEFWGVTVVYVLAVFLLVSNTITYGFDNAGAPNAGAYEELHLKFSMLQNYLIPSFFSFTALYIGYLLMTLYIVPHISRGNNTVLFSILGFLIFLFVSLTLGVCDTWLLGYKIDSTQQIQVFYEDIFKSRVIFGLWLLFLFLIYNVIKHFAIYLLTNEETIREKYPIITREGIIASILWMITFFLLLLANADKVLILAYAIIIPCAILLYWYSIRTLIPGVQQRKKRKFLLFVWKAFVLLLLTGIPLASLLYAILFTPEGAAAIVFANAAFQLVVTVPVSWFVYKYKRANASQINSLKLALGDSNAHLDMLRAQINPHFLFNSLNTLYGTALQEKADRTGEGIQRLGDMMRFMLDENVQDKISLNRETEYIMNYISLQKLRTDPSPGININVTIDDSPSHLSITPMLLIPFIENAFKHGISLREPSHIKITLQLQGNAVYFDVYNSKHGVNENDPERNNNGIGLNNVKQRLDLYYPDRHELIIRENANEYFVHLTIQLDQ